MSNSKLYVTQDGKFAGTVSYNPLDKEDASDNGVIVEFSTDKPKLYFDESKALGAMLCEEVVFFNASTREPLLLVICNDVFAWGTADAEEFPLAQTETLYRMWKADEEWGAAVWCMLQRKEMPQKPVEKLIREDGIWDLDSLNLDDNTTDAWLKYQLAKHLSNRAKEPAPPA